MPDLKEARYLLSNECRLQNILLMRRLHIQFVKRFGILFGPNIMKQKVWENIWPKYLAL